MQHIIKYIAFSLILLIVGCGNEKKEIKEENVNEVVKELDSKTKELGKAEIIVNEAIKAHGGHLYDSAAYQFTFRSRLYSFVNSGNHYKYEVKRKEKDWEVLDVLEDGEFKRVIRDENKLLSEKDKAKYIGALNSVIYFATLPHKLKDGAVNKTYKGRTVIKGDEYDVVRVTFNKEGGGQDYDDEFYYWINVKTKTVDYLAYNYQVNGGGVRFRSAYNPREIGGVRFQDYVNYKASLKTPLEELPALYEKELLKELSRIEIEDIVNLKDKKK